MRPTACSASTSTSPRSSRRSAPSRASRRRGAPAPTPRPKGEIFAGDIRDVVAGMITGILGELGKTPAAMSRDEKMEVVKRLEERGGLPGQALRRAGGRGAGPLALHHLQLPQGDPARRAGGRRAGAPDEADAPPATGLAVDGVSSTGTTGPVLRAPTPATVAALYALVAGSRQPLRGRDRPGQERRQDHRRERPAGRGGPLPRPHVARPGRRAHRPPHRPREAEHLAAVRARSWRPREARSSARTTRSRCWRNCRSTRRWAASSSAGQAGSGEVEVSGPTTLAELRATVERLQALGAAQVLVDGAINRIGSASPRVSDGLVLATGGMVGDTLDDVLETTAAAVEMLTLPAVDDATRALLAGARRGRTRGPCASTRPATPRRSTSHTVIGEGVTVARQVERLGAELLYIGGALTQEFVDDFVRVLPPRTQHAAGGPRRHRARPAAGRRGAAAAPRRRPSRCSRRCACSPSPPTPSGCLSRTGPRSSSARSPRPSAAAYPLFDVVNGLAAAADATLPHASLSSRKQVMP